MATLKIVLWPQRGRAFFQNVSFYTSFLMFPCCGLLWFGVRLGITVGSFWVVFGADAVRIVFVCAGGLCS